MSSLKRTKDSEIKYESVTVIDSNKSITSWYDLTSVQAIHSKSLWIIDFQTQVIHTRVILLSNRIIKRAAWSGKT